MEKQGRIRKSTRNPVPNPIYKQSICELRNENASRRKKNKNSEENGSLEDERNSHLYQDGSSVIEPKDHYLPCKLPDGRCIQVKFIIGKEDKKKEIPSDSMPRVSAPQKKPTTTNLLNIFFQAIDNASVPDPSSQPEKPPIPTHNLRQLPRRRGQSEQFIKKVTVSNGVVTLQHSHLQQLTYDVDWTEEECRKPEENQQVVQMRRNLENLGVLKDLPVLYQ